MPTFAKRPPGRPRQESFRNPTSNVNAAKPDGKTFHDERRRGTTLRFFLPRVLRPAFPSPGDSCQMMGPGGKLKRSWTLESRACSGWEAAPSKRCMQPPSRVKTAEAKAACLGTAPVAALGRPVRSAGRRDRTMEA
ncbi:hypothetical protein E4U34_008060 [Claviceps purpurea]|nr:hypothetical protein E4U34_008060 [Claviceps purpurea]